MFHTTTRNLGSTQKNSTHWPIWNTKLSRRYVIQLFVLQIPEDQQAQVIKQLLLWQDLHPRASPFKIPEITITIINNLAVNNIIVQQNFSRMGSFRNSLRKLISNKISPETSDSKPRYVTFNDVPVVYKISKMPKHCWICWRKYFRIRKI